MSQSEPQQTAHADGPDALLKIVDQFLSWVALIGGGLTLVFMVLLSVTNVLIMRKALNNPIYGAEDLLVLGLVAVVAFSIPFGARTGAHIEIEILETRMSKAFARFSMIGMKILGLFILGILSWRLWDAGSKAAKFGESSQNLLISFGPFYYLLAVWVAIYCLVLLLEIWQLALNRPVSRLHMPSGAE